MRTILWDLDGTIADTEELHYRAWQATMDEYGFEYSYTEFLAGFGRRNGEILAEKFGTDPSAEIVLNVSHYKESTFRRLLSESDLQPLPGVLPWLENFAAAGMIQVVSSSGPMANIAAIINKLTIGDFFLCLMSGAQLVRGKPDPTLFLNSAAAVAVAPGDCIVIEDSIHGIAAARRAGMASIAVGKLAYNGELPELLDAVGGPSCLALGNLERLSWEQYDALWKSTRGLKQHEGYAL
jgi:HAD superfamily hydrolase (TIGR01509 family)